MPQPLHPVIVHFPIVLIITALVFHVLYLLIPKIISAKIVLIQLAMGIFGAFISVWTGEIALQEAQPIASVEILGVVEKHEFWANSTIWSGLIVLICGIYLRLKFEKRRWIDTVLTAGLITLTIFVIKTALLGAELVHVYHIFVP